MKGEKMQGLSGTLIITHSSRKMDVNRCSRESFIQRYSNPGRLKNLPPFEDLPSYKGFAIYTGAITFLDISSLDNNRIDVRKKGWIEENRKIQHVSTLDEYSLLVASETEIEVWRSAHPLSSLNKLDRTSFTTDIRCEHPFFAGIHTVFPLDDSRVVVSASAPDAVCVVDLKKGELEKLLRMPADIYGSNYDLHDGMDLRKHYIHNDLQTTHINSAFPFDGGNKILVSCLIPGCVGVFDTASGSYKELISGYYGCHGARVTSEGEIYFADSCRGDLVFLDHDGSVSRIFHVDSQWLHDVQQISGSLYAFTMTDLNEIRIYDINTASLVFNSKSFFTDTLSKCENLPLIKNFFHRLPSWAWNSTQFLYYATHT